MRNFLLLDGEIVLKQLKIWGYPEVALAEGDVVADGQDDVGRNVVGLQLIHLKDFREEIAWR